MEIFGLNAFIIMINSTNRYTGYYCKCSEDTGIFIKEKYFQISGEIEGEFLSEWKNS